MATQPGSGAACLAEPDARSRAGGYRFLGAKDRAMLNGPACTLAKATKSAMAPAMGAEVKALFMNAQALAELRQALEGMGQPQPPTRGLP